MSILKEPPAPPGLHIKEYHWVAGQFVQAGSWKAFEEYIEGFYPGLPLVAEPAGKILNLNTAPSQYIRIRNAILTREEAKQYVSPPVVRRSILVTYTPFTPTELMTALLSTPRTNPSYRSVVKSGICFLEEDDPKVLYHCTPTDNVHQVLADGLQYGQGENWSDSSAGFWSRGKLFFAVGYAAATQWQGILAEQTGRDIAILEVKLPASLKAKLLVDRTSAREGDLCSFYLQGPTAFGAEPEIAVSSRFISVADTGYGSSGF